jgi:hypothetical protein
LDPTRPEAPVALEIAIDGVAIAWGIADRRRPDLEMLGLGDGACAFDVRFDATLPAERAAVLTVRRADDGTDLIGSPVLLLPPRGDGPGLAAAMDGLAAAADDPARIAGAALLTNLGDELVVRGRLAGSRNPSEHA